MFAQLPADGDVVEGGIGMQQQRQLGPIDLRLRRAVLVSLAMR